MDLFGFRRRKLLRRARNGTARLLDGAVKEAMTDYVVTITPEKSAVDAASIMIGEDVSALVVEQESRPVGILTERDFIKKVPVSQQVFSLPVSRIMSCSFAGKKEKVCAVESVQPSATLAAARAALGERRIRKLVVTSPEGLIAGIITQSDLSKAIYERLKAVPLLADAKLLVKDVMTKKVVSVPRTAGFAQAKRLMASKNLSALPVTEKKEYVGIFTEYDVVAQFFDSGGKLAVKSVNDLMKAPVKAIPASLSIFDANTIMLFEKVRRLLVVDEGRVVGIVTQTDLVHACFDYAERARKTLAESSLPFKASDIVPLRRSTAIISEYAGEHLRAYTMK